MGLLAGSEPAQRWAVEANAHPPVLRTHDRYGHRIDEVDIHPSWHALLDTAIASGANIKVVQQMLGHKSATMTLDLYGHLFPDGVKSGKPYSPLKSRGIAV